MFIATCKIDDQSKFNAWSKAPNAGALGPPRGIGWDGDSGWEGHIYSCGWFMLLYGKVHDIVIILQLKEINYFF